MKKILYILIGVLMMVGIPVFAAPVVQYFKNISPSTDNTYNNGDTTHYWASMYTTQLCLSADCRSTWPTSGSGSTGNVSTSSSETNTYIPFWTSTNGTPALLSGGSSNLTWNGTKLFANYASTTAITSTGSAYFATAGGNVGIGTTAPGEQLTVKDVGNTNQFGGTLAVYANNLTQGVSIGYNGISKVGSNANSDLVLEGKGTGGVLVGGATIGSGALQVLSADNLTTTNIIAAYASNKTQGFAMRYNGLYAIGSNSNVDIDLVPQGTGNVIIENGNVGIGTTVPLKNLDIGGSEPILRLSDNRNLAAPNWVGTNIAGLEFYATDPSSGGTGIKGAIRLVGGADSTGAPSGELAFSTATFVETVATEKMRIDKSGNVGIGTTTPSDKLTINGNGRIENQGQLKFSELRANGNQMATISATSSMAADVNWTLPATDGTNGQFLATNGVGNLYFASPAGGGTVTSVAQTVPTGLTITGSPVTGSGTLAIGLDTGYVIPLQSTLNTYINSVSTSTNETSGQLAYWTTSSGSPAKLNSVATSSPTIDAPLSTSGTAGALVGGSAFHIGCTTASSGVAGCLSSTMFDTFNGKENALTFTYPLQRSTNTISLAFGTTTSNTWAGTQTFINASTTNISSSYSSSTAYYAGNLTIPSLGTAAGTFLAADATGKVIATSTPGGTGTNYWTSSGSTLYNNVGTLVGINNTTPAYPLDIKGVATSTPTLVLRDPLGNVSLEMRAGTSTLYNTFIGKNSGKVNTTGSSNTANGYASLYVNTTGSQNTANGYASLSANTTGSQNTANGYYSLSANTTGSSNTANGYYSLSANDTGSSNTANGYYSLYVNTTGNNNVALGYRAGAYETGSNSFYVNNVDQTNTAGDKAYSLLYGTFSGTAGSLTGQKLTVNGLLGIGTSTPTNKLTITDSSNPQLTLSAGAGIAQWAFRNAGGNLYFSTTTVAGTATTTTSALTITGSGKPGLAISSSTPFATLSVNPSAGDFSAQFAVGSSSATSFLVTNGGFVGVSTSSPATALDVNGTITQKTVKSCTLGLTTDALGSITGCVASDLTLKKDISDLSYNPNLINELRPVFYEWKDTNKDTQQHAGFIAQDVQKVFPQAVVSAGTGLLGVDSNAILALVVKQMQNLQGQVSKPIRSVEENWQDILIGLLVLGFIYQQYQIHKLKNVK